MTNPSLNPSPNPSLFLDRTFNTQIDINLREWAEGSLSQKAVDVGWETLQHEFKGLVERSKGCKDHDPIFDTVKSAVVSEAMNRHVWNEKATDVLKVIQLNALEDRTISTKQQWDSALQFLESSLKERYEQSRLQISLFRVKLPETAVFFLNFLKLPFSLQSV